VSNQVDPKSFADRLVALAVSGLVIAVALYFAVHLIEAIAGVLIGIAVFVGVLYLGWLWLQRRRSGW
jgi:hypothetical protein